MRGVGLTELMMQCGMLVGATSFTANLCDGVFTHYKREEDESLQSGKLDEELSRMSDIADHIASNCVLLCNGSFAATNEREGSQIARQVVEAMASGGHQGAVLDTHVRPLRCPISPDRRGIAVSPRRARG